MNTARPLLLGNVRGDAVRRCSSSATRSTRRWPPTSSTRRGRSLREVTDEVLRLVRGE